MMLLGVLIDLDIDLGRAIRDCSGSLLLAGCRFKEYNFGIQASELKAVLESLLAACLGGWNRIMVESNAFNIIDFLNTNDGAIDNNFDLKFKTFVPLFLISRSFPILSVEM